MADSSSVIQVFLKESEYVQLAINRSLTTFLALFGVVIPSAFGVVLYVSSGDKTSVIPTSFLGVTLTALVSLAQLYAKGLWMEAFEDMRYRVHALAAHG